MRASLHLVPNNLKLEKLCSIKSKYASKFLSDFAFSVVWNGGYPNQVAANYLVFQNKLF